MIIQSNILLHRYAVWTLQENFDMDQIKCSKNQKSTRSQIYEPPHVFLVIVLSTVIIQTYNLHIPFILTIYNYHLHLVFTLTSYIYSLHLQFMFVTYTYHLHYITFIMFYFYNLHYDLQ